MTFDCRPAKITGPVVRGLHRPSTQSLTRKALHKSHGEYSCL